jgi:hypothetical protein
LWYNVEELEWAYDPAPYVLGYYATGSYFNLAAITLLQRPREAQLFMISLKLPG